MMAMTNMLMMMMVILITKMMMKAMKMTLVIRIVTMKMIIITG